MFFANDNNSVNGLLLPSGSQYCLFVCLSYFANFVVNNCHISFYCMTTNSYITSKNRVMA